MLPISVAYILERFDASSVHAIVLMGSYARGEAGPYSDIDIVRFTDGSPLSGAGSYLHNDHLIVVSDVSPTIVETWFTEPEAATNNIPGIRQAQALLDRNNYFATIQARTRAFEWNTALQERANQWASEMMVGLIEEVHKGLGGLQRNDTGRMLNAQFGFSWLLHRVIKVQKGILITGDNNFYEAIAQHMGPQSTWAKLGRTAFGIEDEQGHAPLLREQIRAGLQLYALTAQLLTPILRPEDAPLIVRTVERIQEQIG